MCIKLNIFGVGLDLNTVADLRGAPGTRAPSFGPKFLYFHAVFKKNWLNSRLAPPLGVGAPPSGKSWDPPLK